VLEFTQNLGPLPNGEKQATERLSLDYEGRTRTRRRVLLDSGREAGLFLERGKMLGGGDILRAEDGTLALVLCKAEAVVTARTGDRLLLARGCWHLGNRHVPLQIEETLLRFAPDPAAEQLARQLGFVVKREYAPFTPEGGAYAHVRMPEILFLRAGGEEHVSS
jgi:urease accessory protein